VDEVLDGQRHLADPTALAIVLIGEGHPAAVEPDEARVGDRRPVGVAGQIGEHALRLLCPRGCSVARCSQIGGQSVAPGPPSCLSNCLCRRGDAPRGVSTVREPRGYRSVRACAQWPGLRPDCLDVPARRQRSQEDARRCSGAGFIAVEPGRHRDVGSSTATPRDQPRSLRLRREAPARPRREPELRWSRDIYSDLRLSTAG
jgi:hypothetical protein